MRCTSAIWQTATACGGRWPAEAAQVAPLASAGHRRWPSVRATHRLRRKSLRGLDGIAVDASSVWQLQAVVVLGLRRASRGWHEQRNARASRRVASDCRRGSWAVRCGAIRRQPAAVRLGSGCGGRRARAFIHAPWLTRSCQGALAGDSCGSSALVAAASDAAPATRSGMSRSAHLRRNQLRFVASKALRRFWLR